MKHFLPIFSAFPSLFWCIDNHTWFYSAKGIISTHVLVLLIHIRLFNEESDNYTVARQYKIERFETVTCLYTELCVLKLWLSGSTYRFWGHPPKDDVALMAKKKCFVMWREKASKVACNSNGSCSDNNMCVYFGRHVQICVRSISPTSERPFVSVQCFYVYHECW